MKTLFLCGHESPFGLAYLEPLLKSNLGIKAVIIADEERWKRFRESLVGTNHKERRALTQRIKNTTKSWLKQHVPERIVRRIYRTNYWKPQNIRNIMKHYKVPVWEIYDINSHEVLGRIENLGIDLIISAAYPQIFSKDLLSIPPKGSVNIHPSLLPRYRGANPHYWAIVRGERFSGISAHFMTEEVDKGEIIVQIKFPIDSLDYSGLYRRLNDESNGMVNRLESHFLKGEIFELEIDGLESTYFRNPRAIHRRIFWDVRSAEEISNLVRGGGAFCFFRNMRVEVTKCFPTSKNRNMTNNIVVENGIIVDIDIDFLTVSTRQGYVNIQELVFGNRPTSAKKFANKYKLIIGERLS